jgi:hypothetical protein
MESSTTGGDPYRRYEVIEKAYCDGRWDTVLENGTVLLRELPDSRDQPEIQGLRHRMHLLMAHTLLHGYGDRDAAEDLYTLVHQSGAESSLRQMAEDGLDQCHRPLSSTFVAEESEDDADSDDRPRLFLPESEDEAVANTARPAERDKPDPVIALHPLAAPSSESNPEPEPKTLEKAPAISAAARQEVEEATTDPGLAADPFQPARGSRRRPETLTIGLPVMPWLTPGESAPEEEPSPPHGNGNGAHVGPLTIQPLIPEVVEEPELIEIHQATPSLAEEVDLVASNGDHPLMEEVPPTGEAPAADHPPEASAEEDLNDLRSSLLVVRLG